MSLPLTLSITGDPARAHAIAERLPGHFGGRPVRVVPPPAGSPRTGAPAVLVSGAGAPLLDDLARELADTPVLPAPEGTGDTLDRLGIGIFRSTPDGNLLEASRAFLELLGFDSLDEAVATPVAELYADAGERQTLLHALRTRGRVGERAVRLRRRDGRTVWVALTEHLVSDGDGEVLEGVIENISRRKRAEEALRMAESAFRNVAESSVVGIYVVQDGRFVYVNPRFAEMFGTGQDEVVDSLEMVDLVASSDVRRVEGLVDGSRLQEGGRQVSTIAARRKDGSRFDAEIHVSRTEFEGEPAVVGTVLDVSERLRAEAAMRRSEARYRELFENATDIVFCLGRDGRVTSINRIAEERTGYSRREVMGRPASDFVGPEDRHELARALRRLARPDTSARLEITVVSRSGEWLPIEVQARGIHRDGRLEEIHGIARDVSERKQLEAQLRHQASHDPLTGLANWPRFLEHLRGALARMRKEEDPAGVAVLFLDLDGFKAVNDSIGHLAGNHLLECVAGTLQDCIRPTDLAARPGGDEFTVVLEKVGGPREATAVARRIRDRLALPMEIDGREVLAPASIGMAFDRTGQVSAEDLVRHADAALAHGKRDGPAAVIVYDEEIDRIDRSRQELEADLRTAIAEEQFELCYQPIVELESGRIAGVEALLRWRHPRMGLLLPGRFLRTAEESGILLEIDRWVLTSACRQMADWTGRDATTPLVELAVNLSGGHFQRVSTARLLVEAIDGAHLRRDALRLELRESVVAKRPPALADTLHELDAAGVGLRVDDYGIGLVGVDELRHLPIEGLKIDPGIVAGLGEDGECEALVRTVRRLASDVGMRVIAEGVETKEQWEQVRALGVTLGQGYLFSAPLSEAGMHRMLQEGRVALPSEGGGELEATA